MQSDESAILSQCRAGNYSGFTALYDAYAGKIYRFIYYKTHHRETAEDLTSIVFTKALERAATYDERKGTFSAWLYQIARNAVIDHYRVKRPTANIEDAWDLEDGTDIERDADAAFKTDKVKQFLQTLTPRQREVVTLRLWQELSYEEIAEVTGTTTSASKMAYSRAMRELREKMPAAMLAYLLVLFR